MDLDLTRLTDRGLLAVYSRVMRELRNRGSIQSSNNPVADVAERLAARAFTLRLAPKSEKGFDASDSRGVRYQVKGRRLTPENQSTELSIVRNLDEVRFDYLLAIYFDEFWGIHKSIRLTHAAFSRHASYSSHRNGHRFTMTSAVLLDPECDDVTSIIQAVWH